MKKRKRTPGGWLSGIFVALLIAILAVNSSGSGTASHDRYLPLVVKNAQIRVPVGPVGGTFTALVVDPNQNKTLYAGSYVSGVYKTFDQGDSWYQQNNGLTNLKIQSLAIHQQNSNIVYAGTYGGGVYNSYNGGDDWQASNGGVLGNHIIYDLEIDPNNSNVIYAATRVPPSLAGNIYRSRNAGASWSLLIKGDVFSTPDYFYDIDVNPLNSNELYLTTHEHGFYKSTNAGVAFYPINTGVYDYSARSFALDSAYPGLVYGAVWHDDAVYRTWNYGYSWTNSRVGLPVNTAVYRLYADPFGGTQKRVFACTYGNGLYSTDNFAQSWTSRGLNGERLYDFIVANGSPKRWFAATESHGVFRANAGDSVWKGVMGDLRLNAVTAILQEETTDQVYAAVYGLGVYAVSADGLVWDELTQKLADKGVIDLAFYQGKLHILTETMLYVSDEVGWRKIGLPEGKISVENLALLSEKVGLPGEVILDHLEQAERTDNSKGSSAKAVLPLRLVASGDNLYLGTIGNGLFMRVANEWLAMGFTEQSVPDIAINPANEQFYALACETTSSCHIYQSRGEGWALLEFSLPGVNVNKLLYTKNGLLAGTREGIYQYNIPAGQPKLLAGEGRNILSISDSNSCNLAATGQGFVLLSRDCGDSWQEVALENWHYQAVGFLGSQDEVLLIGAQEAGAAIIPLE